MKCKMCRRNQTKSSRSLFCEKCYKARRDEQMKHNQANFRKRIKSGIEPDRRLVYGGEPTRIALASKKLLKLAQKQIAEQA